MTDRSHPSQSESAFQRLLHGEIDSATYALGLKREAAERVAKLRGGPPKTSSPRAGLVDRSSPSGGDVPDGPCGLCGGYGAASERGDPRPCIACGKEAEFAVLMPLHMLNPDEPTFSGPQHHGLRVIEGGGDVT